MITKESCGTWSLGTREIKTMKEPCTKARMNKMDKRK
jgi:hypothetical protein